MAAWFDKTYDRLEGGWDRASRRKRRWIYLGTYTLVFLGAILLAYIPFFQSGKSFVLSSDGVKQHYPLMVYFARSVRRYILGALQGEFSVPMFDITLDLGDDVIGLLNSLGRTDPLLLLAALVPTRYSEIFYCFLTMLRVYLAGLSFTYLCRYFHKPWTHCLIASAVYCLSGFGLAVSIRHPYFANSMIQLPLLICGVDKVIKKERPYLFIAAVFYLVLGGFYHLYMITIMIGVYVLIRFFDIYDKNRMREFIATAGRCAGCYILGVGLSSMVLLPAVEEFLYGGRNGHSIYHVTDYTWAYFRNRFLRMFSSAPGTGWTYPTFVALAFFALLVLFSVKRRRTLKLLTLIVFVSYFGTFIHLVMNGFQYPSARWTFGLTLVVAYVVAEMLPELLGLRSGQRLLCILGMFIYLALVFGCAATRKLKFTIVGAVFIPATLLVLTMTVREKKPVEEWQMQAAGRKSVRCRAAACLALVVMNAGVISIYRLSPDQGNYVGEYEQFGDTNTTLVECMERELEPYLYNNMVGRADSTSFMRHFAGVWQIPGMLVYSSVANGNIITFFNETEASDNWAGFDFASTGQRTIVNTLLSEKYHIEAGDNTAYVPYGYSKIETTEKGNLLYENDYALPWGYTYDSSAVISYEALERMNGLQKQEAMLQTVALENVKDSGARNAVQYDAYSLPYESECNGCEWNNGTLKVTKADATVTLLFDMPMGVEGYVRLNRFDMNGSGVSDFSLKVVCNDVESWMTASSDIWNYYYGRENYLFNLGYSEDERHELTITFPTKGTFKLDDIELYALPMDNYPAQVEALRAEPLENIQWGTNSLTGTVDLSKDKILCVSVPYSKGWTATVDGEKVEILRGNYMFMCLPLTAGHHDIEFHYCSPGIKLGAVLTVCSAAIVTAMLVRDRTRKKKEQT